MQSVLQSIILENLSHDVDYILYVYDKQSNVDENMVMDTRRFRAPFISNPNELWLQIVHLINHKGRGADIVEVMPLIDEYIEFIYTPQNN